MSCWTRALFFSAIAREVSRRISDAHLPPEVSRRFRSRAGEKEKSVLVFVVVVVVGVGVVEGCC